MPKLQYRGFAASKIVTMMPPTHTPTVNNEYSVSVGGGDCEQSRAASTSRSQSSCTGGRYIFMQLAPSLFHSTAPAVTLIYESSGK